MAGILEGVFDGVGNLIGVGTQAAQGILDAVGGVVGSIGGGAQQATGGVGDALGSIFGGLFGGGSSSGVGGATPPIVPATQASYDTSGIPPPDQILTQAAGLGGTRQLLWIAGLGLVVYLLAR